MYSYYWLSGKSIYSEGIADHYWPWLVFLSDLISSRTADPKETMSYRIEGENFHPSLGGQGLSKELGWGTGTGEGIERVQTLFSCSMMRSVDSPAHF